jgi:hypothetical protein
VKGTKRDSIDLQDIDSDVSRCLPQIRMVSTVCRHMLYVRATFHHILSRQIQFLFLSLHANIQQTTIHLTKSTKKPWFVRSHVAGTTLVSFCYVNRSNSIYHLLHRVGRNLHKETHCASSSSILKRCCATDFGPNPILR